MSTFNRYETKGMKVPYYIICRYDKHNKIWTKFSSYKYGIVELDLFNWRPARRMKFIETAIKFKDKILSKFNHEDSEVGIIKITTTQTDVFKKLSKDLVAEHAYKYFMTLDTSA